MQDNEVCAIIENEDRHWWYRERRFRLNEFLQKLEPKSKLLDIGPAGGAQTIMALNRFGEDNTVALEYNFVAAKHCAAKIPLTINGDGSKIPLKSETIDVVICMDTLEHIQDDYAVLREIKRVLKPHGLLFISVPALMILWSDHDISVGHFRRYRRVELSKLLTSQGYKNIDIFYFNSILFPIMLVSRIFGLYGKTGEVEGDHKAPSRFINGLLSLIVKTERLKLFRKFYGSSLFAICGK